MSIACPYCQNARISQALRDGGAVVPKWIVADALADQAVAARCSAVCAAYNEPMIAGEWVRAVFAAARARGLTTVVVSDGNTTDEALAYLRPVTDVYRVDLKGFTDAQYVELGGRLAPVLDAIGTARALGYWHAQLPPHARPRRLATLAELPRLPSGKIDRLGVAALPTSPIDYACYKQG